MFRFKIFVSLRLCNSHLLLSASTYFVVRVLSACVICTIPRLGILWFFLRLVLFFVALVSRVAFLYGQTPESGIRPSDHATRRYTKVHLDFCLRFSTLISQIGRVPLFGAGTRRYIRSGLFRLAVTVFWRALTASWWQKGKRKQVFPRAIRTTELPSNPSPLTFRNNQIQMS